MTDLTTVHHRTKSANAGNQRKRSAARYVRLLRLSSSGALACVAITGMLAGIAGNYIAVSVPSWVEWTAGAIGFTAVIAVAYLVDFKDR